MTKGGDGRASSTSPTEGTTRGAGPHPLWVEEPPELDLLHTFAELLGYTRRAIEAGEWLNGFLFAAGANQIFEDYLASDWTPLRRVGRRARHLHGLAGSGLGKSFTSLEYTVRLARRRRPQFTRLARLQQFLAQLVDQLASATLDGQLTAENLQAINSLQRKLQDGKPFPRGLSQDVIRLPSCFRSFDLQPSDVGELVERVSLEVREQTSPIAVVGIRSSGSYLAPLGGAYLRRTGYRDVTVVTARSDQHLLRDAKEALLRVVASGGRVLVVDDPPNTGATYLDITRQLLSVGVPRDSILLLVPLFGCAHDMPECLKPYRVVSLPWNDWSIQGDLQPDAVKAALHASPSLSRSVVAVERLELDNLPSRRGHVHALYRAIISDTSGERREQLIHAQGIGLGYMGGHAQLVQRRLAGFVPCSYASAPGLLFTEWLADSDRLCGSKHAADLVADNIAGYVVARTRLLPAAQDRALRLVDRKAAWQGAAELLGASFGRSRPLIRPILHRAARSLCEARNPTIVDGSMSLDHWFSDSDGRFVKVDSGERAFSNRDVASYDPLFDLAGAAAGKDGASLAPRLLAAYTRRAGYEPDPERWLIYQLVHYRKDSSRREDALRSLEAERGGARAFQTYIEGKFFEHLQPGRGAICAVDIDGVLESNWLGFPAISPAGARSLRALAGHGYQVVLATGRSLAEVRERCAAYHLAGGVAEYGAVSYDHGSGRAEELLSHEQRDLLERLRTIVTHSDSVFIDPLYTFSVRAFRVADDGGRRALAPSIATAAVEQLGSAAGVVVIHGDRQTDFVPAGVNKGAGLARLAQMLRSPRIAMAIGDSEADLTMLQLADRPFAPANAHDTLRRRGLPIGRRRYQGGLAEAATSLLGHKPGMCERCSMPPQSLRTQQLLTALSAWDVGKLGKARTAGALAARLWRT